MIYVNSITGVDTFKIEQGTDEWLLHRAGCITASRISDVLMQDRQAPFPEGLIIEPLEKRGENRVVFDGKEFVGTKDACTKFVRGLLPMITPDGKSGYMNELIAQVCTGLTQESVKFKQAEYGHEHEPLAREAYEAREFEVVETCGLIYRDDTMRCAVSPDGLTDDRGLEIKCPFTTAVHIDTLVNGKIKPEYHAQYQFCMWVTGMKRWDFVSFDPRMRGKPENRLFVQSFEPDGELFDRFDAEVPKFIAEMDERLAKLGFTYGDQWRQI
ncbi:MAG: lambda exonuclease family protein [Aeromonadaceae bacterium]